MEVVVHYARNDLEIQYILGKVNFVDHLSKQLLREAAERKGQVHEENQQFVDQLRVSRDATDAKIQDALWKILQRDERGTQRADIEHESDQTEIQTDIRVNQCTLVE